MISAPAIGIEEEYQLVDPNSGRLLPKCKEVLATLRRRGMDQKTDSEIQHELHLNQIEIASDVCSTLADVQKTLVETRSLLVRAARDNGCELAAAGTNPLILPEQDSVTPKDRYQSMGEKFQRIAKDLYIFGCHVHVSMPDKELGIQVMNRCRRWLPILQAITASSPYWDGTDTGYASYRRELWAQWPMAGPPPHFENLSDYHDCVNDLKACGAIQDESFLYWDIRLPTKVPTIEFRAADVLTRVGDAVGYAGLIRAMAMTATHELQTGKPTKKIRSYVLSHAIWHSARYGMTDCLVDVSTCEQVNARALLSRTITECGKALDATGDRDYVDAFVDRLLNEGTGADRQRQADSPKYIVSQIVRETCESTTEPDRNPLII